MSGLSDDLPAVPSNARPVRAEDAFDVAAVASWLVDNADRSVATQLRGTPEVLQFAGGASNLTYLLRYPDRDLVLRRPPAGAKPSSGHDMRREHRVQSLLAGAYPHVPAMIGLCQAPAVIGSDFYVMERVDGKILRGDATPENTPGLTPARTRELCADMFDLLIELHQVDPAATGLDEFSRGPGYVARQVSGWTARYAKARTENVPDFADVARWLAEHQPADVASAVIHGDFRLDNIVLGRDLKPVAVLDWELATIGDPLMDLGSALAYWVEAEDDPMMRLTKRQPSDLPGMSTRAEIVERYLDKTGLGGPGFSADSWLFYEVFGLFRLAVIVQQIYFRYHHGQTHNPAFKDFWVVVGYLDSRCAGLIGGSPRR